MVEIKRKEKCCGCEACVQACPRQCISFETDGEGFCYPHVNAAKCVQCGRCRKVCPMLHPPHSTLNAQPSTLNSQPSTLNAQPSTLNSQPSTFTYQASDDDVLMSSSSGGLFSAISDYVLDHGGVVAGARFDDNWNVVHALAATRAEAEAFRTSKYLQSRIGDTFKQVDRILGNGQEVLFCGTPCQVAALKRYLSLSTLNAQHSTLNAQHPALTTVDFICHGVPSPMVWQQCLKSLARGETVTSVNFRSKVSGWRNYRLAVTTADGNTRSYGINDTPYTRAFSKNITLRPSCYKCPMRGLHRASDITLADFWGCEQTGSTDDRGTSLALAHSDKGVGLLNAVGAQPLNIDLAQLATLNPSFLHQTPVTALRSVFFSRMARHPEMTADILDELTQLPPWRRRYYKLLTFMNKTIGKI